MGARHGDGGPAIEIRLGGIYALEKLAKDSRDYHGQIFETLTAYLRENAPWPPATPASGTTTFVKTEPTMRKDFQAILTVIGRRRWTKFKDTSLDLSNTDLQKAQLYKANFERAWFFGANLKAAGLMEANLKEAWLKDCNLTGASLVGANLANAQLVGANLTSAVFAKITDPNSDAIGLTLKQIQKAENYDKAILPTYLQAQLSQNQQNTPPPQA